MLKAKRYINIRTDNPAGLAASQLTNAEVNKRGVKTVDVPVTEPGTAPQYSAAIRAANPKPGDVIQLSLTAIGAATVYDALRSLNVADGVAVVGSDTQALPPMPGHLKDARSKDTVFPDGWYMANAGYTPFMPSPDSNGADVYVAMMGQYAPDANLIGYGSIAFSETLEMVKFLTAAGGPDATAEKVSDLIKNFTGPAVMKAGKLKCGALTQAPNLCSFSNGYAQRKDGQWGVRCGRPQRQVPQRPGRLTAGAVSARPARRPGRGRS